MYHGSTIAVVVPAYNEGGLIGDVIETMPSFVDRVYVVDDASTDETWPEIQQHVRQTNARAGDGASVPVDGDARLFPRVVATRHETNRGVGAAIKRGYAQAIEDGIDVIAVMDGDGQMDPDELHRIVEPIVEGRAVYSKGNRLHRRSDRAGMSRWRLFGNGILTLLTRAASGYWEMSDPQNGYTAISREALETIPFRRLYDRYGFANELLVLLNAYDFTIANVSHPAVYGDEESHIRYSSFIPTLSWLLLWRFGWRLKTRYMVREFHPIVAYYPVGIAGMAAGVAGGIYALATSVSFVGGMSALAVGLLGFLIFSLAVWFDVERNSGSVVSITDDRVSSTTTDDVTWVGTHDTHDRLEIEPISNGSEPAETRTAESDGGVVK